MYLLLRADINQTPPPSASHLYSMVRIVSVFYISVIKWPYIKLLLAVLGKWKQTCESNENQERNMTAANLLPTQLNLLLTSLTFFLRTIYLKKKKNNNVKYDFPCLRWWVEWVFILFIVKINQGGHWNIIIKYTP